jgi:hypothetical protein
MEVLSESRTQAKETTMKTTKILMTGLCSTMGWLLIAGGQWYAAVSFFSTAVVTQLVLARK